MAFFDQADWDIRFEWGLSGVEQLGPAAAVAVIVDVLSFTTAVDVAVGRGAEVLPFLWRDERAEAFAAEHGALLASHDRRQGLSLSPASLQGVAPKTKLVLPSPNGATLAFSATSGTVVAACLRNAEAVAAWINRGPRPVAVFAAGERWADGSLRPAIEDLIGAGAVIIGLAGTKSPEARAAEAVFLAAAAEGLDAVIRACSSGRELVERGFEGDVALASALSVSGAVPMLQGGAFQDVVASGR
ncbi:MAG: 2-phosphosulfolactate phosphatase [Dehalococcoidia bacterium]